MDMVVVVNVSGLKKDADQFTFLHPVPNDSNRSHLTAQPYLPNVTCDTFV